MQAHLLGSGAGWRVEDIVCSAGPRDRPFEEMHDGACVALVVGGTFHYRAEQGSAVLAPGSILLGNYGTCYRCGHDHSRGDRCLSFHFSPDLFEDVARGTPGVRRAKFAAASLPPLAELAGLTASLEAVGKDGDAAEFEELALRFAAAVMAMLGDDSRRSATVSLADERRISEVLHLIETNAHERVSLAELARVAGMSRFHFLRLFQRVVGMTPHQYVLHTRLHRAAVRLRCTDEPVSAIAFDAGFEDLSTFNRRFRRIMGATPGAFRGAV